MWLYTSNVPLPSAAQAYVRCLLMLAIEPHDMWTYRGLMVDGALVWC